RIPRDLGGPLAVHRLLPGDRPQVEGQIGDINPIAATHEARREEKADRTATAYAVEVAELRDGLARLVGDDDLVGLVRTDPDVVVLIDHQAVRAIDAVREHAGGAGDAPGVGDANHRVVSGVGDEKR